MTDTPSHHHTNRQDLIKHRSVPKAAGIVRRMPSALAGAVLEKVDVESTAAVTLTLTLTLTRT